MTGPIITEHMRQVEAMKDQLRASQTIEEINEAVRCIAPEVEALEPDDPVSAIQIRNLAAYRRMCVEKGWG